MNMLSIMYLNFGVVGLVKRFLVLFAVFFLMQSVFGERLYSWGKAELISIDAQTKTIKTFDGFEIRQAQDGVFSVWKNGAQQARFIFALKGTFQGSPVLSKSNDFLWDWSALQNSPQVVEVEGKRQNYDSAAFKWKVNLLAKEFEHLKITNFVRNDSVASVSGMEFFYVVDVNTVANPFIEYVDENNLVHQYDWSTNFSRSDEAGLAKLESHLVELPFFGFQFQDLIDSNFFLTRLFAGNLNDLHGSLPVTKGFVVGFSKGNGILGVGQEVLIDPNLTVSDTNDGRITFQETTGPTCIPPSAVWVSDSNAAISVGLGSALGCDFARPLVEFTIGDIGAISNADLNIYFSSKSISGETCTFDLNSVTTIGSEGISGKPSAGGDWNSVVFEKVIDNWFSNTIDLNQTTSVTTAWNNSKNAGRTYLTFRLGMDNELGYTNANNSCSVTFCDTGQTGSGCQSGGVTDPFISYTLVPNSAPDVNVNSPNGAGFVSQYRNNLDTNTLLDFNVSDVDGTVSLLADIYLSTNQNSFTTIIVNDLNLLYLALSPTVDANCSGSNFATSQRCFYDWNTATYADANFFIDVNVFDASDANKVDSSNLSFRIDQNKAATSWDGNHNTWQTTDANVKLTCTDVGGAGCSSTRFRKDTDSTIVISYGAWTTYDANIFFASDGNFALDFNSTDYASNIGDTNTFYVLIEKTLNVSVGSINETLSDSGTVTRSLAVKNNGNVSTGALTVSFSCEVASAPASLASIGVGVTGAVPVSIASTGGTGSFSCPITVSTSVSPVGSASGSVTINLQANSGGNNGTEPTIIFGFEIVSPSDSISLTVPQGSALRVPLVVKNIGDVAIDSLKVNADGDIVGVLSLDASAPTIGVGSEGEIGLLFSVPEDTALGRIDGKVIVYSGTQQVERLVSLNIVENTLPNSFSLFLDNFLFGIQLRYLLLIVPVFLVLLAFGFKGNVMMQLFFIGLAVLISGGLFLL